MNDKNDMINNLFNLFPEETFKKASNYVEFIDVVKCAKKIRDVAKEMEKLGSDEKRAAAILVSKRLFDQTRNK